MAFILSFVLIILVLYAGFKDAATSKHPVLMRILVILIALALIAAMWYGINYFTNKYIKN